MEKWKDIPTWEGFFEVSDQGQIRSCSRLIPITPKGRKPFVMKVPGRVRRQHVASTTGYKVISLQAGERSEWKPVHVIVCEAFHGPKPEGFCVAHLNGSRTDNRAENLAWSSYAENHSHKHLHGTAYVGERCHMAKMTEAGVLAIRARAKTGESYASIGRSVGMTKEGVSAIARRLTWKHI